MSAMRLTMRLMPRGIALAAALALGALTGSAAHAAGPLDERYVDDGSVTADDRKKFSLRSGATSTALPTVGGAIPGERMSDAEVMAEVGGKKRITIIAVVVALVALLGIFFWKQFKAKDVSKNAAALTPTEIPTQAPPEVTPPAPPPAPPVAAAKQPAAAAKDTDEPTPKAARPPPAAKKHAATKGAKAKGKKTHK